jgi:transposase InsO family protein
MCGRHRVARLMREHGIVSKHRRKFRITTRSSHNHPVAENKLQRRFSASAPGLSWVADITYIPTQEGWLYLTDYILMQVLYKAVCKYSRLEIQTGCPG